MIYSEEHIKEYRALPQNSRMLCKKTIAELLKVNGQTRTSAAIGQWFIEPHKVLGFENLTRETILYNMKISLYLSRQQLTHQNQSNFFSNFFKF